MCIADIDLQRLAHERLINTTFGNEGVRRPMRTLDFDVTAGHYDMGDDLMRPLAQLPFVPSDPAQRAKHCREIFAIKAPAWPNASRILA